MTECGVHGCSNPAIRTFEVVIEDSEGNRHEGPCSVCSEHEKQFEAWQKSQNGGFVN